jgi:hypothetical protein
MLVTLPPRSAAGWPGLRPASGRGRPHRARAAQPGLHYRPGRQGSGATTIREPESPAFTNRNHPQVCVQRLAADYFGGISCPRGRIGAIRLDGARNSVGLRALRHVVPECPDDSVQERGRSCHGSAGGHAELAAYPSSRSAWPRRRCSLLPAVPLAAPSATRASASASATATANPANGTFHVDWASSGTGIRIGIPAKGHARLEAYQPTTLFREANSYEFDWLFAPYSVRHARVVDGRFTFQVQLCETGNGHSWNHWHQWFDGGAMMLSYTRPLIPVAPFASDTRLQCRSSSSAREFSATA